MNEFLTEVLKTGRTENGAVSYSSSGLGKYAHCVDYFAKCGTYLHRSQDEVASSMSAIFADDEEVALRLLFGTRLITRKQNNEGEFQTGFGLRNEFARGFYWLCENRIDLAVRTMKHIHEFGCWRDFFNAPIMNVVLTNPVIQAEFCRVVKDNWDSDLLKKYAPNAKSFNKCKTDRAKQRALLVDRICRYMNIGRKEYRLWKSSGAAHTWQKQMSFNQWNSIDLHKIPGRAMTYLVNRTGKKSKLTPFERHGQATRLLNWIKNSDAIKFTGFIYELAKQAKKYNVTNVQKTLLDKQFETAIQPLQSYNLGRVLPVLDTSGSMTCEITKGVSALNICMSLGIAFSSINSGHFKDVVCMFDNTCEFKTLRGTFTDKMSQIPMDAMGGTNFQSVIDLLVQTRQNENIPLDQYPDTLLVVSDMQFNAYGKQTNLEASRQKLESVGLGHIKLIWWFVNGNNSDFPSTMNEPNVYMLGGFDPNVLKTVNSPSMNKTKKATPLEGMMKFISQPIFDLLQ